MDRVRVCVVNTALRFFNIITARIESSPLLITHVHVSRQSSHACMPFLSSTDIVIVYLRLLQRDLIGNIRHEWESQLSQVILPETDRAGLTTTRLPGEYQIAATGTGKLFTCF